MTRRGRLAQAACVLLAAAAGAWFWLARDGGPAPAARVAGAPTQAAQPGPGTPPAAGPAAAPAPASTAMPASAQAAATTAAPPGARSATGVFESDAAGRLVLDERTRLAVEALVGLNPADALPALVEAEVRGLPPAAAQAARELVLRFDAYQAAQRAAFTPGQAPLVPQEGLAELDALVALRTSYFGADAARRMFGADEAVARRLLQLMAEDRSTHLSMEQKAMRAQLRYDQERGVAPR